MKRSQRDGGCGGRPTDDLDGVHRDLIAEAIAPELKSLAGVMAANPAISPDEQLEALRWITGVQAGSAWNGYTMGRVMGMSPAEANRARPTGMLLDIARYLGAEAPSGLQTAVEKADGYAAMTAEEYAAAYDDAIEQLLVDDA
jgi:hypothetical protein